MLNMDKAARHSEVCTRESDSFKAAEPMLLMQTFKDAHTQTKKH